MSAVFCLTACKLSDNGSDKTAASTAATSAATSAATTAATQSANAPQGNEQTGISNAQNGNTNQQQGVNTDSGNSVGITSEQAIANVKAQVGSDAEILSCVEGFTPDNNALHCYVIEVKFSSGTTVAYYSGYQLYMVEDFNNGQAEISPSKLRSGSLLSGRAEI